jgi:DNA-binding NarL/FixJ family response regulator
VASTSRIRHIPFGAMPRVAIAATEGLRSRLAHILDDAGVRVAVEASNQQELETVGAAESWWDVGVYEISAADLTMSAKLVRPAPGIRVVAVAPMLNRSELHRTLEAGADGVVVNERAEATLVPTIRAVASGQIVLASEFRNHVRKPLLSVREKQVLGMVVLGLSNAEVAEKLFLSESTVKSHLSTAFGKLGVRSRKEASALILDPVDGLGTGILAISNAEHPRGRPR